MPREDRRERRAGPTIRTAEAMVDQAYAPEQPPQPAPELPRERVQIPGAQLAALQGRWEELHRASRQLAIDAERLHCDRQRLAGEKRTWKAVFWTAATALGICGALILWTLWRYQP